MSKKSTALAIQKHVYMRFYCQTRCKWEKPGPNGLRFFKRYSARVARRSLARALRQDRLSYDES